jgi:hypothetical protein
MNESSEQSSHHIAPDPYDFPVAELAGRARKTDEVVVHFDRSTGVFSASCPCGVTDHTGPDATLGLVEGFCRSFHREHIRHRGSGQPKQKQQVRH